MKARTRARTHAHAHTHTHTHTSCVEARAELCRERAVAHLLHWFSTTKEERLDNHAGHIPRRSPRQHSPPYRRWHAPRERLVTCLRGGGGSGNGANLH
jgi:hypothetical protein